MISCYNSINLLKVSMGKPSIGEPHSMFRAITARLWDVNENRVKSAEILVHAALAHSRRASIYSASLSLIHS